MGEGSDADTGGLGGLGGFGDASAGAAMGGFDVGGMAGAYGGGLNAGDGGFGGMAADVAADAFGMGGFPDIGFGPAAGWGAPEGLAAVFGEQTSPTDEQNPLNSTLSEKLRTITRNPIINFALSLASKTNPALAMAVTGLNVAASEDPAKAGAISLANLFGNKLGFNVPMVGGLGTLANMATSAPGGVGSKMGSASSGGINLNDLAGGLAGLYTGYRGMRDNSRMMGGLKDLYSQNSPYAQALRQQLERKDAQAGRRSQYGPREVELQARLAQLASGQIPALSQMQNNQALMRAAMLKSGLGFAQKMGLFDKLQGGLNSLLYNNSPTIGQGLNPANMFNGEFVPSLGDNGGYTLPEFNWGI